MADHLTMIKDGAERVGENTNHGQQDQRPGLMDGGLFESGWGGEGLEHFRVHPPAAARKLVDEGRRNGT